MSNENFFTAIIVNYNGEELLIDCINSIVEAGIKPCHIIIIDNGSKDNSINKLKEHDLHCQTTLLGCNAGFAKAVNIGLKQVKTEFAVLINNDASVTPNAFHEIKKSFKLHPKAAFIGGRLLNKDGSNQHSIAPFPRLLSEICPGFIRRIISPKRFDNEFLTNQDIRVESVIGALFSIRMSALNQIGLLDEDFFFFLEETEWCHRAAQLQWETWHAPLAQAIHFQGATAKKYNALARIEYHRSRLTYYKKTSPNNYQLALSILFLKAIINATTNLAAVLITLFMAPKLRKKTMVYCNILIWYLLGRPENIGLPDKCPAGISPCTKVNNIYTNSK